ncbi:hypothetical protein ABH897_005535 [Paenibacillus sp. RC73]
MYLEEGKTSYQPSKNLNLDAKMIRRCVKKGLQSSASVEEAKPVREKDVPGRKD